MPLRVPQRTCKRQSGSPRTWRAPRTSPSRYSGCMRARRRQPGIATYMSSTLSVDPFDSQENPHAHESIRLRASPAFTKRTPSACAALRYPLEATRPDLYNLLTGNTAKDHNQLRKPSPKTRRTQHDSVPPYVSTVYRSTSNSPTVSSKSKREG